MIFFVIKRQTKGNSDFQFQVFSAFFAFLGLFPSKHSSVRQLRKKLPSKMKPYIVKSLFV